MLAAVIIFFFLGNVAAKNCFSDDYENCSIVKIAENFYSCDVVQFDKPIKKIGFSGNKTLFEVYGGKSVIYSLDDYKKEANIVQDVFDPVGKVIDMNNNSYYFADGSTYVNISKTQQIIEITTSNNASSAQLALDIEGNTLFILTLTGPDGEEYDDIGKYFFALKLNPLHIVNNSIQAEWLEEFQNITAITAHNGKLFFGVRTLDAGKLVILSKTGSNSNCLKNILIKFTEQYIEKIATECESVSISLSRNRKPFFNNTLNAMMSENIALKTKLDEAQFNCKTEKPNDKMIKIGPRPTRNASFEDEVMSEYEYPDRSNLFKRSGEIEDCPPAFRTQLENSNLKARLRLKANRFASLVSSIYTLNEEFEAKPVPVAEEEESYEEGYRRPKKCLEAYQLNALTDGIEHLEQVEINLRQKLLEYTEESKTIFAEENPTTEEYNDA